MYDLIRLISNSAYDALTRLNLADSVPGRYELSDGIYVNVECYNLQLRSRWKFESHRRFVDIQYLIEGTEIITVADAGECEICNEYDVDMDVVFYENSLVGIDHVLSEYQFLTLTPQEVHMPGIKVHGCDMVKKAVVKVPVELYLNRKKASSQRIKYLIMDVDGTLTDGKIYMGGDGELVKSFDIKDGYGIHNLLPAANIEPIIITGRESLILEQRCKELSISALYQGVADKAEKLNDIMNEVGARYSEIAYIGDDINDVPCMKRIKSGGGIIGCPSDASNGVCEISDFISQKKGGDGAVRGFIEWLTQ